MARLLVLDSGPLWTACKPRESSPEVEGLLMWLVQVRANGALIFIPEIADFEVRRELIRRGATIQVERLDELGRRYIYVPLNTEAMRRAAGYWAGSRSGGIPTAPDDSLDADAILAAQANGLVGHGDQLIVVSQNVEHLRRYVRAALWQKITT